MYHYYTSIRAGGYWTENGLHEFQYFNALSSGGGTLSGRLGGVVLLEVVSHCGWPRDFKITHQAISLSPSLCLSNKCELLALMGLESWFPG